MQFKDPKEVEYVPAAQFVQLEAPVDEYVPANHLIHDNAPCKRIFTCWSITSYIRS